ncbi:hypothetical protein Chor_015739 [Crotalus horridus]
MFEDNTYIYLLEPLEITHSMRCVLVPKIAADAKNNTAFKSIKSSTGRLHVIRRTFGSNAFSQLEDLDTDSTSDWSFLSELQWLRRRRRAAVRGIFEEMKYLELMIVNDHKMFKKHRSSHSNTNNFAKSVVNLVDAIYKEQLNTRVVLVAVETWSDRDRIHVHSDPRQMLHDFSRYRQNFIKQRADAVHLLSNVTFHYKRSSLSYFGGICSVARGVGVNEYGLSWAIAQELSQSLAQNLGIQWEPASRKPMSITPENSQSAALLNTEIFYSEEEVFVFSTGLQRCIPYNPLMKLFDATECGNGYVEPGEDCDCGIQTFFPRGFECRYAVNECDITEICTGDSGQCPPNLHKQDGFACDSNQGRCYNGECKTRDNQCKYIWGNKASGSHKHCYEKLNTEGTQKGNCGKDGDKWIPCHKHDVFCGLLLCANLDGVPRIGHLQGEIIPTSFFHQGVVVNCSCAHVLLDDETDLGYVEDGTPCGPNMMCMDRRCLSIQSLNISSCPMDANGKVCSGHGVSPRCAVMKPPAFVTLLGQVQIVACLILEGKMTLRNQADQRVCVISVPFTTI